MENLVKREISNGKKILPPGFVLKIPCSRLAQIREKMSNNSQFIKPTCGKPPRSKSQLERFKHVVTAMTNASSNDPTAGVQNLKPQDTVLIPTTVLELAQALSTGTNFSSTRGGDT